MAPEVFYKEPYGCSADVYSLGMVMYWLLNDRRLPFVDAGGSVPSSETMEKAQHRRFSGEELPPPKRGSEDLQRIIRKACAFRPADR